MELYGASFLVCVYVFYVYVWAGSSMHYEVTTKLVEIITNQFYPPSLTTLTTTYYIHHYPK